MVHKNQTGFTIFELMIAISVFSMAVLLVSAVVIGISKQYQKASYTAQLNDASRNIHQIIANSINYDKDYINFTDIPAGNYNGFCANNNIYFWKPINAVNGNIDEYGLFTKKMTDTNCVNPNNSDNSINLLPKNGFVTQLHITSSGKLYSIITSFRVGDKDMFESSVVTNNCLPTLRGGNYCSVVDYTSSAYSRL